MTSADAVLGELRIEDVKAQAFVIKRESHTAPFKAGPVQRPDICFIYLK